MAPMKSCRHTENLSFSLLSSYENYYFIINIYNNLVADINIIVPLTPLTHWRTYEIFRGFKIIFICNQAS